MESRSQGAQGDEGDADEHQFFQQVFADDPNADLAELAASQSSSVLKNTHLQRISNRKKQVHNPDLEDFKIDLVDEKVKEEDGILIRL